MTKVGVESGTRDCAHCPPYARVNPRPLGAIKYESYIRGIYVAADVRWQPASHKS